MYTIFEMGCMGRAASFIKAATKAVSTTIHFGITVNYPPRAQRPQTRIT